MDGILNGKAYKDEIGIFGNSNLGETDVNLNLAFLKANNFMLLV